MLYWARLSWLLLATLWRWRVVVGFRRLPSVGAAMVAQRKVLHATLHQVLRTHGHEEFPGNVPPGVYLRMLANMREAGRQSLRRDFARIPPHLARLDVFTVRRRLELASEAQMRFMVYGIVPESAGEEVSDDRR